MNPRHYTLLEPTAEATPLLVSIPHTGVDVPPEIAARFVTEEARGLPDTDWHLHRLYAFARELGATVLHADASRYVVDLNRPRDAKPLYPGRTETGLIPTRTFGGATIYAEGDEPDAAELQSRVEAWWDPYHSRLQQELARLKERFGYALLFDAHSITSVVPDFFEGELPGLVLGDANGATADAAIIEAVRAVHAAADFSTSHNSPFRGGYITRSYGQPSEGVHALQLEMAQRLYMHEGPPFAFAEERADALQPLLRATLTAFLDSARTLV